MSIQKQYNTLISLDQTGNKTILLILEKSKETLLQFSQGPLRALWMCFINIFYFDFSA